MTKDLIIKNDEVCHINVVTLFDGERLSVAIDKLKAIVMEHDRRASGVEGDPRFDLFTEIDYGESTSYAYDGPPTIYIVVKRPRHETDEEYTSRIRIEENMKELLMKKSSKDSSEPNLREYLEYLRLSKKYDNHKIV